MEVIDGVVLVKTLVVKTLASKRKMAGVVICAINFSTEAAKIRELRRFKSRLGMGYIDYQASGLPYHSIPQPKIEER